jgi:CheY-like chemotaxis protein
MTPQIVEHAFEPFYTTKSKGAGRGLGPATVYGATAQAEGHVRMESEPGKGTTFTMLLPVTTQPATEATRATPSHRASHGETVLVVEDEDALREVTRRLLTRQGYHIITAANGTEAVAAARSYQGSIHLLLTDVIMPHMQGKEVAQTITAGRPGLRVLYMSGSTQSILASQGRLDPNVTLLDKPFTETELLAKVSAVLACQPSANQA